MNVALFYQRERAVWAAYWLHKIDFQALCLALKNLRVYATQVTVAQKRLERIK